MCLCILSAGLACIGVGSLAGEADLTSKQTLVPGEQTELEFAKFTQSDFFDASKVIQVGTNDNSIKVLPGLSQYDVLTTITQKSSNARGTVTLNENISFLKPFEANVDVNIFRLMVSKTVTNAGLMLTNTAPSMASWTNSFPETKSSATWTMFVGTMYKDNEFSNRCRLYVQQRKKLDQITQSDRPNGSEEPMLNYTIKYDPHTRLVTVSYQSEGGVKQEHQIEVPNDIKSGTLSLFGAHEGDSRNQSSATVQVNQADGYYRIVDTPIKYKNNRGETLGDDSILLSTNKQKVSISGDELVDVAAPQFKGFKLKDEKQKRVIMSGTTKQLVVTYDYENQDVPITLIDDDDEKNKLPDTTYSVEPYKMYTMTSMLAQKYLPVGYRVASIENAKGMVEVSTKGDVTKTPIKIHVKHIKVKETKEYTRAINYQFDGGMTGTLPKNVVQTIKQYVESDRATNKVTIIGTAKKFPSLKVPQLNGFESNLEEIPEQTLDDETPFKQTIDVTYYQLTKLLVPETFDFGTVEIGSAEYYGRKSIDMKAMTGQLGIISANPAHKQFDVSLQVDSDTKTTQFTLNHHVINIGEATTVYQVDKLQDVHETILLSDADKSDLSMRLFTTDMQEGLLGKAQHYTFNWALRNVPA